MAKWFNTTWGKVLSYSIVNFMYKSEFVKDQIAKERRK